VLPDGWNPLVATIAPLVAGILESRPRTPLAVRDTVRDLFARAVIETPSAVSSPSWIAGVLV
jgi:hypothetical protein